MRILSFGVFIKQDNSTYLIGLLKEFSEITSGNPSEHIKHDRYYTVYHLTAGKPVA